MTEEQSSHDKYLAERDGFRADMEVFREEVRDNLLEMKVQLSGFGVQLNQLETRLKRLLLAGAVLGGLLGGAVATVAKLI